MATHDPRRTPAVEIFERYQTAVVYLTGPMAGLKALPVEEFFRIPNRRELNNLGTGVVIHESGYILTNAHAVEHPIYHEMTFADGSKLPAEVISIVREHDLALMKVETPRPLKAVTMAKPNDLRVGEPVIVIGNPEGLQRTCTTGVISALGRNTQPSGLPGIVLRGLIQTDAAVNPGSSGGPWFNALGEMIGITTSVKRDCENIGFGVPIATIRKDLPDMFDIERRQGIIAGIRLGRDESCQIRSIDADSPAAKAGLQPGDVLRSVGDRPIKSRVDYTFALIDRRPGETLKIGVLRNRAAVEVSLALAERPKPDGAEILKASYGLVAIPLDQKKAEETALRVPRGVVVSEVVAGAPWNYDKVDSPPLPGDVLARIDGIRPRDLDHVGLLLDRVPPGKMVNMVLLRRSGATITRIDLKTFGIAQQEKKQ